MMDKIMNIFSEGRLSRATGKIKKRSVFIFLLFLTGCAIDLNDWEPKDETLVLSVKICRKEMLLRDPYLGRLWHISKDFEPCMRGTDHYKK